MSTLTLTHTIVDLERLEVARGSERLALTTLEARLLRYLSQHVGETISRADLLVAVWDYPRAVATRSVDNTVTRLRAKIEADPKAPEHLLTVRGVGYRLELPSQAPSAGLDIIGRDEVLVELSAMVGRALLVTVLGCAGIGKTTLVSAWAMRRQGPVLLVPLEDVRSGSGINHAVAAALSFALGDRDVAGGARRIARSLSSQEPGVLILDNFEQLTEHAEQTVGQWLASGWRIVVTSRHRLGLRAEQCLHLSPLSPLDAQQLFLVRARPRHPWSDSDRFQVAALVASLEGVPLAIELAAARTGLLTVAQIHARLSERLRLLADHRSGRPARQATLRGALEWSWALLESHEQDMLAGLGVFAGVFSVDAVEAIFSSEGRWAVDVLESLLEKSLLVHRASDLGMLAGVAELAREKLAEHPDREAIEDAHAAWLTARCETGRQELSWLRRHGADIALAARRIARRNPAQALTLLRAGEWAFRLDGFPSIALYRDLIADTDGQAALQAEALLLTAQALAGETWTEEGLDLLERAVALPLIDETIRLRVLLRRGAFLARTPRREESRVLLEQAAELAQRHNDRRSLGISRINLGYMDFWAGESERAEQRFEQALADFAAVGVVHLQQHVLNTLVGISMEGRPSGRTQLWLERSRALAEQASDPVALAWVDQIEGNQALDAGQLDEADALSRRALAAARRYGAAWVEGPALLVQASIVQLRGDLSAAESLLERARPIYETYRDPSTQALLLGRRAVVAWLRGEPGAAQRGFAEAHTLAERSPDVQRALVALEGFMLEDPTDLLAGFSEDEPTLVRRCVMLLTAHDASRS